MHTRNKIKKSQLITRGYLPNNSPIKIRILEGEKLPPPSLKTSFYKTNLSNGNKSKTIQNPISTTAESLGYKSFYKTKNYHIVYNKVLHN